MSSITLREYFARPGSRFTNEDARLIGPALDRLGAPKAQDIVDAARNHASPLHPYFEWRDDIAAEEYRKAEARTMARSIVIKVVSDDHQERLTRAFEAVTVNRLPGSSEDAEDSRSYVAYDVIRQSPDLSNQVIQRAKSQLSAWRHAYETYRALYPSFDTTFRDVFDIIHRVEQEDQKEPLLI